MLRRFGPAAGWVVLLLAAWSALLLSGADPVRFSADLLVAFATGPWVVPVLLGAYLLRALVLFPATALALFAGWSLGPVAGAATAWLGVAASASLAYLLARVLRPRGAGDRAGAAQGAGTPASEPPASEPPKAGAPRPGARPPDGRHDRFGRWQERIARNTFETVLIARLAAAPGDAVNVAAGAVRAPFWPFLAATALGGVPGLLAVVWAGASIEGAFVLERTAIRPGLVGASVAMALVALAASAWFRRRGRAGRAAP